MSYLPELRRGLVDAARRGAVATGVDGEAASGMHRSSGRSAAARLWSVLRPWGLPAAWRSRRWGRVALNLGLSLAGVLAGLTASGVFQRGSVIRPGLPISPSTGGGSVVPGSVKLLPIRASDPAGGLPWGLRVVQRSRGLTCVEVGRVDYGTIGILGIDGVKGNDGRFHPLSSDVFDPVGCAKTDANGHGFLNVALEGVPASGLTGVMGGPSGCRPSEESAAAQQRVLRRGLPSAVTRRMKEAEAREPRRPVCPFRDLREIYYGLLGPDATSITYRSDSGKLESMPTVGQDGAYLVVLRQPRDGCLDSGSAMMPPRHCPYSWTGVRGGAKVPPGAIVAVTYRNGHTCHVAPRSKAFARGSCPPVGYVAPPHEDVTASKVSSPIHVERLPGTSFCEKRGPIPDEETESTKPCGAQIPAGYERIAKPSMMIRLSFTSRIAIESAGGEYEIDYYYPRTATQRPGCNDGGSMGTSMDFDIRRGQRLSETRTFPIDCPGVIRGEVKYVSTQGPEGPSPEATRRKSVPVGRFSFDVP